MAAKKLGQALGEVAKTLQVVDSASSKFLSLGIDEGALTKNSELLLYIDGGSLETEVERGLGSCYLIERIYSLYLDKWFKSVFNAEEYASVKAVFHSLSEADLALFHNLATVAKTLQNEAGAVLDLVGKGEQTNAQRRALSALPALRPLRKMIAKTMQTLYSMQAEFVDMTNQNGNSG